MHILHSPPSLCFLIVLKLFFGCLIGGCPIRSFKAIVIHFLELWMSSLYTLTLPLFVESCINADNHHSPESPLGD